MARVRLYLHERESHWRTLRGGHGVRLLKGHSEHHQLNVEVEGGGDVAWEGIYNEPKFWLWRLHASSLWCHLLS